jgi:hypothetical protein
VLARDVGLAAHLFGQLDAALYLVNFRLPAQVRLPPNGESDQRRKD